LEFVTPQLQLVLGTQLSLVCSYPALCTLNEVTGERYISSVMRSCTRAANATFSASERHHMQDKVLVNKGHYTYSSGSTTPHTFQSSQVKPML
jgi:hypothetical protein